MLFKVVGGEGAHTMERLMVIAIRPLQTHLLSKDVGCCGLNHKSPILSDI